MLSGLDILPLEGARSPMHLPGMVDILERPSDPDCEAGSQLWDLYRAGRGSGRITAHLGDFQLRSNREAGCVALPLGRSLGSAGRGAGLLVRADRSCLVFRTRDRKPWGRSAEPHRQIEFLPIVLRLSRTIAYGEDAVVIPTIDRASSRPDIAFTVIPRHRFQTDDEEVQEISRALGAQLCWEATAWANVLDDIPALSPQGAWPAAFPGHSIDDETLARFNQHATQVARFVVDQEQGHIRGLAMRVFSGRPLQGGVAPARLSLRFDPAGQRSIDPSQHDRIATLLSRLVFQGEFAADLLIAQQMKEPSVTARGLDRVQLVNLTTSGSLSNHERLELVARFGDQVD